MCAQCTCLRQHKLGTLANIEPKGKNLRYLFDAKTTNGDFKTQKQVVGISSPSRISYEKCAYTFVQSFGKIAKTVVR
jgi:hypothetical protein